MENRQSVPMLSASSGTKKEMEVNIMENRQSVPMLSASSGTKKEMEVNIKENRQSVPMLSASSGTVDCSLFVNMGLKRQSQLPKGQCKDHCSQEVTIIDW